MSKIYLEPAYLKMVQNILRKHFPNRLVVVYGSRISEQHKPHSDLDLCVMGDEPLTLMQLAELREDFSESDLPIRVDIVDWTSVSSEFQKIIKKNYIQI